MKLTHDWKSVLRKAWSIRLMLLAGLLSGIEVSLPILEGGVNIPPRLFAVLSGLTVMAAFVARLLAQKGLDDDQTKEGR